VGDVVKIEGGDRVPADMITLYSENDQGTLFLKTDQLDGETDWKLRKAVKMTQKLINSP
jgi:phospholipid-translocating ATPase